MPDEPKPPTDDRERLKRYLEWRERTNQTPLRSVRRRPLRGVLVAAAAALVGVATLSWLSFGMRYSRPVAREDAPAGDTVRATELADASPGSASDAQTAPPTPPASTEPLASTAPPTAGASPVTPKPSPDASRRMARAIARPPVRATAPRPPARAAAPDPIRAEPVDLQSTPMEPVEPAPNEPPTAASPPAAAASATEAPPAVATPVTVAPGTVTSIESKPPCDDVTAAESADGQSRRQRVSDCVGGWLKDQSRQFGDGVKREVDDFRNGLDHVGRGLQWLGSKLRRPE